MSKIDNSKYTIIPIGDTPNGKKYQITVEIPMSVGWIDHISFNIEKNHSLTPFSLNHIKNSDGKAYFQAEVSLETSAIYHYYFSFVVNNQTKYIQNKGVISDNIDKDNMGKMSVNFEAPDWAKGKIMYHIFVDRFNRVSDSILQPMPRRTIHTSWDEDITMGPNAEGIWNADFYGGNLKGIEAKIDYLKSLGVSIIYLSPVMWSQSNHRYDTGDYETVDPYAGCNEDLKSLCEVAHKNDMKVVLDAVFNHTGNDSKYFNEYGTFDNVGAFQSDTSEYAKFYRRNHYGYDYWWGMPNLPVCDGHSKEWQEYILGENGVIDKWFSLGIDGLRLDVADELTDEFIFKIRDAVKRNKKDGFILGEVWKNPMRMNRGYIDSGKGMDSVMNYSLIDALIRYFKYGDVTKLAYIVRDIRNEYPKDTINTLMNFTSTHDITRAINLFATYDFQEYGEWAWNPNSNDINWCKDFKLTPEQYQRSKEIYEAYVFALTFFPGILSIFYGDEVGLQGMGNLANRRPYPWNNQDKALLEYFRYIGQIRQQEKFLEEADINILDINKKYLMFERESQEEKVLVTVNRTDEDSAFAVPSEYESTEKVYTLKKSRKGNLTPYGAIAIKKR